MKIYVICVALFFTPAVFGMFSAKIWDILRANEAKCGQRSGVSDADIEAARKAKNLPENPEMNAFAKCMLEIYNVMKDDGTINADVKSYSVLTDMPNLTWGISENCRILTGTDSGDTARKIFNCYLQNHELVMAYGESYAE